MIKKSQVKIQIRQMIDYTVSELICSEERDFKTYETGYVSFSRRFFLKARQVYA
jgi:hypothetical protein